MNTADQNVIPGFRKMSKQRIFNKAVAHISVTRKKSLRPNGIGCIYSGSGCNAAPLLASDAVRAECDRGSNSWAELVYQGRVPATNEQFIKELQAAHDSAYGMPFMEKWKENMTALAERWNLSTSTLDKVAV